MASIFSRIIRGEIPCYKIAENDNYFAFLDINPLRAGHTLVVPKRETDYIFDLEDEYLAGMVVFSKKIAVAIRKAIPCNRIGVAILGLEVPHAHIHLFLWTRWMILTSKILNLSSPRMSLKRLLLKSARR